MWWSESEGRPVLTEFPEFAWASGEESSDPLVLFEGETVRVDELETTGHLERLESDLRDVADLGVEVFRYGMPWRRTEIAPSTYDWSMWDRALDGCAEAGLTPVVDLCHFGLPDHYPGFCDGAWVDGFIRYVEAFLARYPEPRFFTPVNEPGVTASSSALLGNWNDRKSSPADFALALAHLMVADLEAFSRIREDRDGWNVMAEGFQVVLATDPEREEQAQWMNSHWQATWDLRFGHDLDPVAAESFASFVDDEILDRIARLATTENTIAGHDFYPPSVIVMGPLPDGALTIADRVTAYEEAARLWYGRYGVDFWISETSNLGLPPEDGPEWIERLAEATTSLRADGVPVRGICWYSRGDQHDWDTALTRPVQKVTEVGLFDIDRNPRPARDMFAKLAAGG